MFILDIDHETFGRDIRNFKISLINFAFRNKEAFSALAYNKYLNKPNGTFFGGGARIFY